MAFISYFTYTQNASFNCTPLHVTIPSFRLVTTDATPLPSLRFSFELKISNEIYSNIYANVKFDVNQSYPNGITIPLQASSIGYGTPGINFNFTVLTNPAPYSSQNNIIEGYLNYIGSNANVTMTTLASYYGGNLISALYGNPTPAPTPILEQLKIYEVMYDTTPGNSNDYTSLTGPTSVDQFAYTQTSSNHYYPRYITIPSIIFSDSPSSSLPFTFTLLKLTTTIVAVHFTINRSYPNGITIPLQSSYSGEPAITSDITFTVVTPPTTYALYVDKDDFIVGNLKYTGFSTNLMMTTIRTGGEMTITLGGFIFTP